MFRGLAYSIWCLAAVSFLASPCAGQSVISTHSGVIHYFEGSVYLGDQQLESHLGKFASITQGGELRTEEGRAEVLLTPGVFLRLGERTKIRLVANQLSDTRVELLSGSAIIEAAEPNPGTSVTLLYKNWSVRFPEQGVYRIDTDPPRLQVSRGKGEVSAGNKGDAVLVSQGMSMPFSQVLVPDRSTDRPKDALSTWADGRQQSIYADNAIAANIQDPASLSVSPYGVDSFTNFPILGLSSVGPGSPAVYGSVGTYQPGFNSVYLPGLTYFPNYTYLLLLPATIHTGVGVIGGSPIYGGGVPVAPPHSPVGSPTPVRPIYPHPLPGQPVGPRPPASPVSPHPTPVHPASPAAVHPHASVHH
jgi:hypothetical protein